MINVSAKSARQLCALAQDDAALSLRIDFSTNNQQPTLLDNLAGFLTYFNHLCALGGDHPSEAVSFSIHVILIRRGGLRVKNLGRINVDPSPRSSVQDDIVSNVDKITTSPNRPDS